MLAAFLLLGGCGGGGNTVAAPSPGGGDSDPECNSDIVFCKRDYPTGDCLSWGSSERVLRSVKRGEPRYFRYYNSGNEPINFKVVYRLVTDGDPDDPVFLTPGEEYEGTISKYGLTFKPSAYYAFSLPGLGGTPDRPVTVNITVTSCCGGVGYGFTMDAGIRALGSAGAEQTQSITHTYDSSTFSFVLQEGADYRFRLTNRLASERVGVGRACLWHSRGRGAVTAEAGADSLRAQRAACST